MKEGWSDGVYKCQFEGGRWFNEIRGRREGDGEDGLMQGETTKSVCGDGEDGLMQGETTKSVCKAKWSRCVRKR